MYSKLQIRSPWNPYDVDNHYDTMSGTISSLPAVSRQIIGSEDLPYIDTLGDPARYLSWNRQEYQTDYVSEPSPVLRSGNFGHGGTIQISACDSTYMLRNLRIVIHISLASYYYTSGSVPLRDVLPCTDERNYSLLRNWLSDCMKNHEECRTEKSIRGSVEYVPLPARLVNVGLPSGIVSPSLADTKDMRGSYVTLSHRWGKGKKLETTTKNIDQLKKGIPTDELSQTFKDAIVVTRQLGFQYIWIDSLCIIQDDTEDWLRESGKMGDIFESSSCTLAAVHALDDNSNDCGLFLSRLDPLAVKLSCPLDKEPLSDISAKLAGRGQRDCVWKYTWFKSGQKDANPSDVASHHTIVLRPKIASLWYKVQQSEWYKRGWVFQERILSRRIIYYTRDKIYWQCFRDEGDEQEKRSDSSTKNAWFSPATLTTGTPQAFAKELAKDYSTCNLTYRKDTLLAILGVCTKIRDRYGGNFHAGILDDSTGQCLLWHASENSTLHLDFHAPSWSWTCRSGMPSYYIPPLLESKADTLIRDMSIHTQIRCDSDDPSASCGGTCVSGTVSFAAPVGESFRGMKFFEMDFNGKCAAETAPNELLIWILGSGVHSSGISVPRADGETGSLAFNPRRLYLPDQTELLFDSCGSHIIGYFIPDEERLEGSLTSVVCAGVTLQTHEHPLKDRPYGGAVAGYRYNDETCIDIIGLEAWLGDRTKYRRIGRGRILCNQWLTSCTEKTVVMV